MTGIRLKDKAHEEADTTYGPAGVGIGLLAFAVALTLQPWWSLGALVLILAGAAQWVRESVRENRHLVPVEVQQGRPEATGLRTPTVYWWGALGFAVVQLMVFGAALRVAHAHGLFTPDHPVPQVTLWIGHAATGLAVASAAVAVWVVREARYGDPKRMGASIGLLSLTVLGHLALLGWQMVDFATMPLFPDDVAARSATLWLYMVHGGAALATALAFGLLLLRLFLGPLHPEHYGATHGLALFWISVLVAWLVFYGMIYLRILEFEAPLI